MRLGPLDPFTNEMWHLSAFAHLLAGRYDQALSASERAMPNRVESLSVLAASSALVGRMDKARDAMVRTRERDPTTSIN